MADTEKLWYYIHGKRSISSVSISPNETIGGLKKKIHKAANNAFTGYNAPDLILTKVDLDINGIINDINAGKYRFETNDKPLWDIKTISDVWPQSPPKEHLHIHVKVDRTGLSGESPSKRRRLDNDHDSSWLEEVRSVDPKALRELQQFWKSLWQDKTDLFRKVSVRRDLNPIEGVGVPETMEVLRLPMTFSSIGEVMVRDDYAEAMKIIEGYSTETKTFIISGHPGIGKTTLLYYILVKRLLEQKPTALQNKAQHVFLFDANGVRAISPFTFIHPKSEEFEGVWALVDINPDVEKPAGIFGADSPFFLIMASPPRASRWQWAQRYRAPTNFWFMKTFTLSELIQARQLQEHDRNESDIANFFSKYGPSARDCYTFCSAKDLIKYDSMVRLKVNSISWDSLTEFLTRQQGNPEMDQGSHMALLVQPHPDNRAVSRTTIVTSTVSDLLWERDSDINWQNYHKLFKTLLHEPSA